MKKIKKANETIEELVRSLAAIPNIWSATSVEVEPQKWLASWQIYKAVKADIQPELFGYHFVGFDTQGRHGAISSRIDKFDPVKMRGITKTGRVYQLVGASGVDPDAQYVLNGWSTRNKVVMKEATEEFVRHYNIDLSLTTPHSLSGTRH